MLHARVVRPPSPSARLVELDDDASRARLPGVVAVVRDGSFLARRRRARGAGGRARSSAARGGALATRRRRCPTRPSFHAVAAAQPAQSFRGRRRHRGRRARSADRGPPGAARTLRGDATPGRTRCTRSIGPSAALAHVVDGALTVWSPQPGRVRPARRARAGARHRGRASPRLSTSRARAATATTAPTTSRSTRRWSRARCRDGPVLLQVDARGRARLGALRPGDGRRRRRRASTRTARLLDWNHDACSHTHMSRAFPYGARLGAARRLAPREPDRAPPSRSRC